MDICQYPYIIFGLLCVDCFLLSKPDPLKSSDDDIQSHDSALLGLPAAVFTPAYLERIKHQSKVSPQPRFVFSFLTDDSVLSDDPVSDILK